jgi:peptidoglycan/xylan/chitin deacetylase (PgdA/CDA1 family)
MPTINHKKLLQGRYEAERFPKNFSLERIVPDFAFNVLNPLGLLYRPVVDEKYLEKGGEKPVWPHKKPFAVCLTHDVDAVSIYSLKQSFRMRWTKLSVSLSKINRIKSLAGLGIDLARSAQYRSKNDPLFCYERWLEVEEEIGAKSTFFFWPGQNSVTKRHHTDCSYDLNDPVIFNGQRCTVAEMIREIDCRGWEIGLHPSWYSFDDVDELKRQKESLEKTLGHEIVSVRQHYLHYDIRITPAVHTEAGFKYDSTLGFNDNTGFRFGTCYPWNLYDLEAEQDLPIMEIPLIIQDGAMLDPAKGMRLDEDIAFEYIKQITDVVEKVGGVLTLLWHTHHIIQTDWWDLYIQSLKFLKSRSPWFSCVKEIGQWWEKQ